MHRGLPAQAIASLKPVVRDPGGMLRRWSSGHRRVQLLGRQRESDVLDRVLEAARDGRGGVLAVYGEPGVGKTALLDYVVEAGADFRIARTVGVEGEMELAFAALQQLCSPSLDLIERLPDPQRDASVRARRRRPA
jgi:hypothetical protein